MRPWFAGCVSGDIFNRLQRCTLFFITVLIKRTVSLMRSVLVVLVLVCAYVRLRNLGSRWTSPWCEPPLVHPSTISAKLISASAVCTSSRCYCACSRYLLVMFQGIDLIEPRVARNCFSSRSSYSVLCPFMRSARDPVFCAVCAHVKLWIWSRCFVQIKGNSVLTLFSCVEMISLSPP